MAKWKYKNETWRPIYWSGNLWAIGEELETPYPVPIELGLTCVQTGGGVDPVLYHEDITLEADGTRTIELPMPKQSTKIHLSLFALSGAATFSFLSENNNRLPLDTRGFEGVMDWNSCAKIFITCLSDAELSVSALEAC